MTLALPLLADARSMTLKASFLGRFLAASSSSSSSAAAAGGAPVARRSSSLKYLLSGQRTIMVASGAASREGPSAYSCEGCNGGRGGRRLMEGSNCRPRRSYSPPDPVQEAPVLVSGLRGGFPCRQWQQHGAVNNTRCRCNELTEKERERGSGGKMHQPCH